MSEIEATEPEATVTLLLLGDAGCGKSTFLSLVMTSSSMIFPFRAEARFGHSEDLKPDAGSRANDRIDASRMADV